MQHPQRSCASRALAEVDRAEICRILKVSPGTVSRWIAGRTLPTEDKRREIAASFGIPFHDWELRPDGSEIDRSGVAEAEIPDEPGEDPRAQLRAHVARCAAWRRRAELNGTTTDHKAALDAERRALEALIRMDQGEKRLADTRGYKQVLSLIVEALKDMPDALRAVRTALKDHRVPSDG